MASDLARAEGHLDHLRALLVMKTQVASGRFSRLVAGLENPSLETALAAIARDAEDEKEQLTEIVTEWVRHDAGDREPAERMEPSSRDLVETWVGLLEASRDRFREAAHAAPAPALRARLEQLASRDEAHAQLLRALL